MSRRRPAPTRVVLHVGLPKTGTTFLQASLARNRTPLRTGAGVLYPGGEEQMFLATLDVRGNHKAWGRRRKQVQGTWDDLCRAAREHTGVTVISHELLAATSARRITAALTMLRDLDVHVVVTARDPAHQAVAEWQEGVKHGRRLDFAAFRAEVLDATAESDHARRYRAAQDLPAVLARWGSAVPVQNVHVVCGPPHGSRDRLWALFGDAVGFDAATFAPAGDEARNPSLGVDEIDLLRRVNIALDRRLPQPGYGRVVKQVYARSLLELGRPHRPVPPAELYDDLTIVGRRWVKEIDRAGYAVHGALSDLVPVPPASPARHPDDADPHAQVDVAAASTAELLLRLHHQVERVHDLEAENAALRAKRRKLKQRLEKR